MLSNEFMPQTFDTIAQIAEYIKANCQPWLAASINGKAIAYRGTKNPPDPLGFVKPIRADRTPKDTEPDRHEIFNTMLHIAGSVANRSNSMFVSGSRSVANGFGTPFAVIPIGNFNYAWSPVWFDWTRDIHLEDMGKFIKPGLLHAKPEMRIYTWQAKRFLSDIENFNVKEVKRYIEVDTGLQYAIIKKHEIMIHTKAAVYVNPEMYPRVQELL